MKHVRSLVSYLTFISGRDVDSSLHREDNSPGYCIGMVEVVHAGDEEITAEQYATEQAAIEQYNAGLPPPAPPPSPELVAPSAATVAAYTVAGGGALATAKTILSKADADITQAELKTLVLIMARWLLKKVVVDGWR